MMAAAPASIEVRLEPDATSGLASIIQQYLHQQLADSEDRRGRAARIRGRLGLTATDYGMTVTVAFGERGIAIFDGARPPLDATIAGPYRALTRLLQGCANPLIEHLRGRLRVHSRLRNLMLPLRVYRLMKLSPDSNR